MRSPAEAVGYTLIDLLARVALARDVETQVEGAEWLPREGATLIAARHYHNLFDGVALARYARRPTHIFVTLDWTRTPMQRHVMELACRIARWPAILRTDAFTRRRGSYDAMRAYQLSEAPLMLRAATRLAIKLLREGQTLVIFPEGYPNVGPLPTPKADGRDFLPFAPGFARLAQLAGRDGKTQVSIVPAGFTYERLPEGHPRWRITLRYGPPYQIAPHATPAEVTALVGEVEAAVHALSAPVSPATTSAAASSEMRA